MDVELYRHDGDHRAPDIEEQNEVNVYEKDSLTPPFIANAVRLAAIYHIERIRKLGPENKSPNRSSLFYNAPNTGPTAEDDRRARQRMVRGMLMSDINELFNNIEVLEHKLTQREKWDFISQVSLAGVIFGGARISRFNIIPEKDILFNLGLLFFGAFIARAVYNVVKFWRSVSYIKLVREGLLELADRVNGDKGFRDRDIECLEGEMWDQVPWKEVEDF